MDATFGGLQRGQGVGLALQITVVADQSLGAGSCDQAPEKLKASLGGVVYSPNGAVFGHRCGWLLEPFGGPSMDRLKRMANAFGQHLREALACFGLGLCDSLRPGAFFKSLLLWIVTVGLWGAIFWIYAKQIMVASLVISGLFVMGLVLFAPTALPLAVGGPATVSGMAAAAGPIMMVIGIAVAGAVVVFVLLFLAAQFTSARLVVQYGWMPRIRERQGKRYSSLAVRPDLSFTSGLMDFAGISGTLLAGIIVSLLLPFTAGIVIGLLFCYLNVRVLFKKALNGYATDTEWRQLVKARRGTMTLLGILLVLSFVVPPLGLLAPMALGTSVGHLAMRSLVALRAGEPPFGVKETSKVVDGAGVAVSKG